jgi:hypothetical protein
MFDPVGRSDFFNARFLMQEMPANAAGVPSSQKIVR